MTDLITWLRAQLDDDEQMLRSLDSTALNGIDSTAGWDVRAYVERGRAEVDAKRRIIDALLNERHQVVDDCWYTCPAATEAVEGETNCDDDAGTECRCGRDYRADRYARLLALPYADRPGYRDEWRPE